MKRGIVFLLITLILLVVAGWFVFGYTPKCDDVACWELKLKECRRASYVNNAVDVNWEYTIKGKKSGSCEVEVEVLQIIRGLTKARTLEGKSMTCEIPLDDNGKTIIVAPERDPNLCHGILKEEMQTLLIEKLHQYVLDNVGEIAEELTGIQGAGIGVESNETQ